MPITKEHESVLLEAEKAVHGPRQRDYGHPLDNFVNTAMMWEAILGAPVSAQQVGLCMIALKISRQLNTPKRDNLVDIAGYAETLEMAIHEAKRRDGKELA